MAAYYRYRVVQTEKGQIIALRNSLYGTNFPLSAILSDHNYHTLALKHIIDWGETHNLALAREVGWYHSNILREESDLDGIAPGHMTASELNALRQLRYEMADERGRISQLRYIARILGNKRKESYIYDLTTETNGRRIHIMLDESRHYVLVTSGADMLVNTHTHSKVFVPGSWEDYIVKLYDIALTKEKGDKNFPNKRAEFRLMRRLNIPD